MPFFFFQAEDGIRDLRMSRGLGDVYKRQEVRKVAAREGVSLTMLQEVQVEECAKSHFLRQKYTNKLHFHLFQFLTDSTPYVLVRTLRVASRIALAHFEVRKSQQNTVDSAIRRIAMFQL